MKIEEILGNKNSFCILEVFTKNPHSEFSQREVIIATNLARMTVKRWLEFLVKHDMLTERKQGVNKLFKLNSLNSLVKQIKILIILTEIRDSIMKLAKKNNFEAYLYGSCARGEDEEESDVDILVIGNIYKSDIISEVNKLSAKIKRKIKLNIFTKTEWAMAAHRDKAFYKKVQADKIKIE